jgi:hypothetical protein
MELGQNRAVRGRAEQTTLVVWIVRKSEQCFDAAAAAAVYEVKMVRVAKKMEE